jgi:hypothetical protein
LSFFFEAVDILNNAGISPHYWILVDYQTKQWGEKTISPISLGESLYSLVEFQSDNPAFLYIAGAFNLTEISVGLTSEIDSDIVPLSDTTSFKIEENDSYRILEYSMTEGKYFLNLTVPTTAEEQLTTLEYTWVQVTSLTNKSMFAEMDEKVRVHLYKWRVEEETNLVVAYTPESDLVVKGSVFHLNWSYIGEFSVLEAELLPAGTYNVLIEAQLRTGTYELILTDEVPDISDRYYAADMAPGFELEFGIISMMILGLLIHLKRRKVSPRKAK